MKYHLVTFLFLLAAFALYFLGMALPAGIFMLLGFLAEMICWVRVISGGARKSRR